MMGMNGFHHPHNQGFNIMNHPGGTTMSFDTGSYANINPTGIPGMVGVRGTAINDPNVEFRKEIKPGVYRNLNFGA